MSQINDKKCIKCGVILTQENQYPSYMKYHMYICKSCKSKENMKYVNEEKHRERSRIYRIPIASIIEIKKNFEHQGDETW